MFAHPSFISFSFTIFIHICSHSSFVFANHSLVCISNTLLLDLHHISSFKFKLPNSVFFLDVPLHLRFDGVLDVGQQRHDGREDGGCLELTPRADARQDGDERHLELPIDL